MRRAGGIARVALAGAAAAMLAGPVGRDAPATPAAAPARAPRVSAVSQLESGEAALRGITAVAVIAESTSPELARWGVTDDWLREVAVARVRDGGPGLLEKSDAAAHPRQPLLVVRLQSTRVPERSAWAWHLTVAHHQRMMTVGDSLPTLDRVQAWTARATLGVTSGPRLAGSVREALDQQVAEFVEAWGRGR